MTHKGRSVNGSDEYATPGWLWRTLSRAVGGFDVDPASGAEPTPIADVTYKKEDDGLSKAWYGDVWCNPPYSEKGRWIAKGQSEAQRDEVRTVTMLLPVDTSTDWFHQHVVDAPVFCFVDRRINFVGERDGETGNTSFASSIVVYGDPPEKLALSLEEFGAVFQGRAYHRSTVQKRLGGMS